MKIDEEYKLKEESMRGQRAVEIMADPIMVEAFDTMQARFQQEWADSPVRDTEGRERIWLMQKLLKNVADHLGEVLTTGKLASLQLEQHRTMLQRAKQALKETF